MPNFMEQRCRVRRGDVEAEWELEVRWSHRRGRDRGATRVGPAAPPRHQVEGEGEVEGQIEGNMEVEPATERGGRGRAEADGERGGELRSGRLRGFFLQKDWTAGSIS